MIKEMLKKILKRKTAKYALIALAIAVGTTFALPACQTSPTGRTQLVLLPADQMNAMGAQAFDEMKQKQTIERDSRTNAYVQCITNALLDALPERGNWEVLVFREDSANAFALPGGKIGVHTGMLKVAKNQAQLAAVIGHEIGHVMAQHGNERVSQSFATQGGLALIQGALQKRGGGDYSLLMAGLGLGAQFGILMPFGRTQESEADIIGLDLMAKAGFEPEQSLQLWRNMGQASGGQAPEWLSTHPAHETRIQNLNSNMDRARKQYLASGRKPNCVR